LLTLREGWAPIARICCSVYCMRGAALGPARIRCMMLLPAGAGFCSGCICSGVGYAGRSATWGTLNKAAVGAGAGKAKVAGMQRCQR
jgi:hypothetical protein